MMSRIALAVAATLIVGTQAQAHAKLVASTPALNATVAAPRQIVLTFSEKLQPKFSGFELSTRGGPMPMTTKVGKDRRTMTGSWTRPLAPGAYHVAWHAVTADTHRMQGGYNFTVK